MSAHDSRTAGLFVTPVQHAQHETLTRLMATVDGRYHLGDFEYFNPARPLSESPRDALQRALVRACDGDFAVANSSRLSPNEQSPIVVVRVVEHQRTSQGRLQRLAFVHSVARLDLIPKDVDIVNFLSANWQQGRRQEVSFTEHVGCYMQLIQDLYRTTDRGLRSVAARRLAQYVYLRCHSKILERLCHGTGQRNWFDILSRRVEDLSESARGARSPYNLTQHAWTKSRPSQKQQSWIESTLACNPKLHDEMLQSPLYDDPGRLRVQCCFSNLLHHLAEAVLNLKKYAEDPPRHRRRNTPTPKSLVREVQSAISDLMSFLNVFKSLMVPHIRWLLDYWEPSEKSIIAQDLGQNSRDDQEYPELQDLQQENDEVGTLLRYLWLVCDHEVSLTVTKNSVKDEHRAARHILNAAVHVVDLHYDPGNVPQGFFECLNNLYDKSLDPKPILERCSQTSGQPLPQRNTVHPAAVLVALLANARSREVEAATSAGLLRDVFPVTPGLLRLFEGMEYYMNKTQLRCLSCYCLLHAAIRASPPPIKIYRRLPEASLATKWQPCLFPPFVPRELGRNCMRDFEREATMRLKCAAQDGETEVLQVGAGSV